MTTKIKYFLLGFLSAAAIVGSLVGIIYYQEEHSDPRKVFFFFRPSVIKAPLDLSKIRLLNGDSLRLDAGDIVIIQTWSRDGRRIGDVEIEKLDSLSRTLGNVKSIALNIIDDASQQTQYAQEYAQKHPSNKIHFAKVEQQDEIFQLLKTNEMHHESFILNSQGNFLAQYQSPANWNHPEFIAQLRSLKQTQ